MINVGSDIIVVAVIFFLGKLLYIDPQDEVRERWVKIEEKLEEKSSSFFRSPNELEAQEPIVDFISRSKDLLVGGVALRSLVLNNRKHWLDRLEKGSQLRFLFLDPKSPDLRHCRYVGNSS